MEALGVRTVEGGPRLVNDLPLAVNEHVTRDGIGGLLVKRERGDLGARVSGVRGTGGGALGPCVPLAIRGGEGGGGGLRGSGRVGIDEKR